MGYDCTLHLIDERAVREVFVPKLLGLTDEETPFDRVQENAAELWPRVRRALETGVYEGAEEEPRELDPESQAALLCQLAVIFSACSLPHHYERGLAFSLWDSQGTGVEFPGMFVRSPEMLFEEVVRRYPNLECEFPEGFTGNWSTGVYIPADGVTEVREWLDSVLAKLTKGDRRQYRGLWAVLKVAEQHGLAYWEATDIGVPTVHLEPDDPRWKIGEDLRKLIRGSEPLEQFTLPAAPRSRDRVGGRGEIHILAGGPVLVVDVSMWPPRCQTRPEAQTICADANREGRWLFVSRIELGDAQTPFRAVVCESPCGESRLIPEVREDGKEIGIWDGYLIDGRALLIPRTFDANPGQQFSPWLHDSERMVRAPGLPAHLVREKYGPFVHGMARLTNGSEVFIWDGEGYEWNGTEFLHTFALGMKDSRDEPSALATAGDGFFFLAQRRLFEVHRGKPAVRLCPRWENIMSMLPGPEGGLLLKEGGNDDGDIGKLYFPADETFIHIAPELLGDTELYDFLCWSRGAQRIIASDRCNLYAVPVDQVLALPRYHAKTGELVKP